MSAAFFISKYEWMVMAASRIGASMIYKIVSLLTLKYQEQCNQKLTITPKRRKRGFICCSIMIVSIIYRTYTIVDKANLTLIGFLNNKIHPNLYTQRSHID